MRNVIIILSLIATALFLVLFFNDKLNFLIYCPKIEKLINVNIQLDSNYYDNFTQNLLNNLTTIYTNVRSKFVSDDYIERICVIYFIHR
jgi:hypothetical protein